MENLSTGVVPFMNYQLAYVKADKQTYVAVRPIIEAIGLNYEGAILTIKNHHDLKQYYATQKFLASDDKLREMACLPYRKIYGWLMLIDTNRVGEQARPMLEAFQSHCFDVLADHFEGKQETYNRATEVFVALHTKRAYLKGLQKQQADSELGQEIAKTKKEIRTLEVEQAGLDLEMFGGQLNLLPSPTE